MSYWEVSQNWFVLVENMKFLNFRIVCWFQKWNEIMALVVKWKEIMFVFETMNSEIERSL